MHRMSVSGVAVPGTTSTHPLGTALARTIGGSGSAKRLLMVFPSAPRGGSEPPQHGAEYRDRRRSGPCRASQRHARFGASPRMVRVFGALVIGAVERVRAGSKIDPRMGWTAARAEGSDRHGMVLAAARRAGDQRGQRDVATGARNPPGTRAGALLVASTRRRSGRPGASGRAAYALTAAGATRPCSDIICA